MIKTTAKGVGIACLFLLGILTSIALCILIVQLVRLTYSMGYLGLILRLACCALLFAGSVLAVLLIPRKNAKVKKRNKVGAVIVAVLFSALLSHYFDFIPTIRDLSSEPVTIERTASVDQHDTDVFISTNAPIDKFPSSMLEVLRDEDGDVVFEPYIINGPDNLTRRRKFGDDYHMTITYYPHSKTRIVTVIQKPR